MDDHLVRFFRRETDSDLDARIKRISRRLNNDAKALEAALEERDIRGRTQPVALSAAAFDYLAASQSCLPEAAR